MRHLSSRSSGLDTTAFTCWRPAPRCTQLSAVAQTKIVRRHVPGLRSVRNGAVVKQPSWARSSSSSHHGSDSLPGAVVLVHTQKATLGEDQHVQQHKQQLPSRVSRRQSLAGMATLLGLLPGAATASPSSDLIEVRAPRTQQQ
jgi:hypothetical protein